MATNTTPWTSKILELLADGDWHPREDVVRAASPLVPPDRAFRVGESKRLRTYQGTASRRGNDDTTRSSGARSLVQDAITGLAGRGRVEVNRTVAGDELRLARPAATAQLVQVGWAYRDRPDARWHLCADQPKHTTCREVRPVYITDPGDTTTPTR